MRIVFLDKLYDYRAGRRDHYSALSVPQKCSVLRTKVWAPSFIRQHLQLPASSSPYSIDTGYPKRARYAGWREAITCVYSPLHCRLQESYSALPWHPAGRQGYTSHSKYTDFLWSWPDDHEHVSPWPGSSGHICNNFYNWLFKLKDYLKSLHASYSLLCNTIFFTKISVTLYCEWCTAEWLFCLP